MKLKAVVATTTFNKSTEELCSKLALKTVKAATYAGYDIVVVDGSPDKKMREALEIAGAIVHEQKERGMAASRRQALAAAFDLGADVAIWLEPEKYPLIPFIASILPLMKTDEPHIIVPCRKSFDGYPPYQALSEVRLNQELGRIIGRSDLDLSFGPRFINKKAAHYFLDYRDERGNKWESIFIPVIRALHDGVEVGVPTVDYVHPPEQTKEEIENEEMNKKRDVQREDLIKAMSNEVATLGYTPDSVE